MSIAFLQMTLTGSWQNPRMKVHLLEVGCSNGADATLTNNIWVIPITIVLPMAANTLQTSTSDSSQSLLAGDLEVPFDSDSHHSQLQTEVTVNSESEDLPDEVVDRSPKQIYAAERARLGLSNNKRVIG